MSNIQITTLPNGMRVVSDRMPGIESVAVGAWIAVGTRHEEFGENGVAHMVEHMLFKGTKSRDAQQIAQEIESVGGDLNAYTNREITSYHAHLLKKDMGLGLEIIADMVQNHTLLEEELERERHVVLQEIGMYQDTPDDLVFDEYFVAAYPGQSFGAPVLGQAGYVAAMPHEALRAYIERLYCPQNIVISAAGDIDHEDLVSKVKSLFSDLPENKTLMVIPSLYKGTEYRNEKDLEQAHFILGFESPCRTSDDYIPSRLLSILMGGGMSSRLFQEVREKRGFAYSVYAFNSTYHDSGQFGIYAGTSGDDLPKATIVIGDELQKIMQEKCSEDELERVKNQLIAGIMMGRESTMTRANQQAKQVIYKNKFFDTELAVQKINAVTSEEIQEIARKIFSSRPTLSSLGPIAGLDDYKTIQERIAA